MVGPTRHDHACVRNEPVGRWSVSHPDACAGRLLPCLVRTEGQALQFAQHGLQIKILPQSIVELRKAGKIELFEGRLQLSSSAIKAVSVNGLNYNAKSVMLGRSAQKMTAISFDDFILREYEMNGSTPKLLAAKFAVKKDFIDFTRFYFTSGAEYRTFLRSAGRAWKAEFVRQNEAQTKVLKRSVASEEKVPSKLSKKVRH